MAGDNNLIVYKQKDIMNPPWKEYIGTPTVMFTIPVAQGGFAIVYKSQYKGKTIALKENHLAKADETKKQLVMREIALMRYSIRYSSLG